MNYLSLTISRLSLFFVYFYFGLLKLLGHHNLIADAAITSFTPFMPLEISSRLLGLGEMAIGLLFLIPKLDRYSKFIFAAHIVVTSLPLLLLPSLTWESPLVPTLAGQYIIKNIVLIALGVSLYKK